MYVKKIHVYDFAFTKRCVYSNGGKIIFFGGTLIVSSTLELVAVWTTRKKSLNFSSSSFVIRVNLLHNHPCFFMVYYYLFGVFLS